MRTARGFTLIEIVLALAIVGALLAIMFGGLRIGLAAWRQGDARAERLDQQRALPDVLVRTLGGAFPYRGSEIEAETLRVLFDGDAQRLSFVTLTPALPAPVPVAFTAVTFSLEPGPPPALAIRQKILPNEKAFEAVQPLALDPTVTAVRFRYARDLGPLRDPTQPWEERWDGTVETELPRVVEITLTTTVNGRFVEHPPLVVPLRVTGS